MIKASAPGKVILFGEHAVVFGMPAIAAPLEGLRTTATISPLPEGAHNDILIEAPAIGYFQWLHEAAPNDPLPMIVQEFLTSVGIQKFDPLHLVIKSSIPSSAGLGSGAAASAAVIEALVRFFDKPTSASEISRIIYEAEKIHHGTPSGIDNTVVAHDRVVYFIRDQEPEFLNLHSPLWIVLGDTGERTSTSTAVSQVRRSWQEDPDHFEDIFQSIGAISRQARIAIIEGDHEILGKLMNKNQSKLEELGVSSDRLEKLNDAARQANAFGAKLSGGGMGGFIIALTDEGNVDAVCHSLSDAGATATFVSTIES
ncbi:MAG: mevalonate kinase [Anaerolineales bacterium]